MSWWSWLIIAVFFFLVVSLLWPRRDKSNKDAESSSLGIQTQSKFNSTYILAFVGAAFFIFTWYVWIKWITGPYFEPVPSGPSEPPMWMQVSLIVLMILYIILLPVCIYYLIIRPWRRDRRITFDGIFLLVLLLISFQDPMLNYLNAWCTYNSWLFNMGNWVQDVPGWLSWGQPGKMFAEPIGIIFPGYTVGVFMNTLLGCWVMRRVKKIWPSIGTLGLLGVVFVFAFFWDIVMEAFFFMRLGFFTYPGAIKSLCIFPGHYYQFPIYEAVFWGFVQGGLCALRYFKDDRGRTFVERGLERIKGGLVRKQTIRFLAIYGTCSLFFLVFYNIPAQWLGMHAEDWPEDIQSRSYFMSGSFGEFTGIPAPNPDLSNVTNDQPYIAIRYVNEEVQAIIDEGEDVNDKLKEYGDELKELKYVLVFPDGTEIDLPKEQYDKFPKIVPFKDVPDDYEHRYVEVED